jgi:hypothetical protein
VDEIAFADAIGAGDISVLEALDGKIDPSRPLACGAPPFEIATWFDRRAAAEWLLAHGAEPSPSSLHEAWRSGWQDLISRLFSTRPELIQTRIGDEGATMLHLAAWHGDPEMIQFLLEHGADPTLRDLAFGSTPLGWAEHNRQEAAAAILRQAERQRRTTGND